MASRFETAIASKVKAIAVGTGRFETAIASKFKVIAVKVAIAQAQIRSQLEIPQNLIEYSPDGNGRVNQID